MGRHADRFGKPSENRPPRYSPDAELPLAEEIGDEPGDAEPEPEPPDPREPIPLDWEERLLQEPRRAKNAGMGEYQIPLAWEDLAAWAERLEPNAIQNPGHNVAAFAWTEAVDKDHPSRLWVWFSPPGRVTAGGHRADVKAGKRTRYCYDRVPYSVFVGLRAASSKGKFLDQFVKKAGYLYHGPF
jgi:hypothetical protein